mgnify:FL=1
MPDSPHIARMPAIIAHRGASHDAPENTLAAFHLGWAQGADAVELDIWQTGDGHILVTHDADTRRLTGVKLKVAKTPLKILRSLDAGAWKGREWAGEKFPLLEEVLEIIPAGRRLVIEVKCGVAALPELERVIERSGKTSQVEIISFRRAVCVGAKKRMPDVPVLLLSTLGPRTWPLRARLLVARASGAIAVLSVE